MKKRKILVPVDASPLSERTLQRLIELRESFSVPLTLLHVLDPNAISYRGFAERDFRDIETQAREEARQFLAGLQSRLAAAGIQAETLVEEGYVRETLCRLADSGSYDLLVVGKPEESELRNLLFGQVANHLIHHVHCPVLIV
jgi:nucleotide-binding universal stress UspA family protein